MIRKAALGVLLLLAAAASHAGTAAGQFSVQITLTDPSNTTGNNNACTSASGTGAGASSVQVRCNTNVFVNIAPVNSINVSVSIAPVSNLNALGNARFQSTFRPARDSLLPDYCRSELSRNDPGSRMACRLDDQRQAAAGDEADDGWEFENRRYAMGPEAVGMEKQARLRFQDVQGTLTAVRVAHAGNQPKSIEMLVSF